MKGKLFQLQTAFASSFGQTLMGLLNTWPSYTSNILASNETTPLSEPMTTAEESLLGSLPSLGAMVGSAIVGILMNRLGRRNGGTVMALPFVEKHLWQGIMYLKSEIEGATNCAGRARQGLPERLKLDSAAISWAMVSVTTSKMVVLVARFLGGVAGGGLLVYGPIFISEIAEDSFRGTLASGPLLMYTSGTLLSYIFGWFFTYRVIIWINIVFSVTLVFLTISVKESPLFLLKQKSEEEAKEAIAHYRGCSPSSKLVQDELSKLKQQLMPPVELISVTGDAEKADLKAEEAEKLNADNVQPEEQKKMSAIKLLFVSPASRRAFLVVTTVISMQVMMGMVPVQVFAKKVFTQTDPAKSDLYTVIFALVLMSGCFVTAIIADKAGRRVLIISSSVMVCICMATLGYLIQSGVAPPWVTVLTIMLYCFSFTFGAGTIPYLLLAEVFVSEVQNLASMIIIEWVWFLNFAIIAVFPFMNSLLGIHGTFYCFALIAISNSVISFFIVPETKGLSNDQIQELFLGRKKK